MTRDAEAMTDETEYQVTVRYGDTSKRYHLERVSGSDFREALREAAARIPDEVAALADLLEMRPAVDPDEREWVEPGGE